MTTPDSTRENEAPNERLAGPTAAMPRIGASLDLETELREVAQMGGVIGASIGPIPLGLGYDYLGGYGETLVALAAIPVVRAVAVAFMRAPRLT